MALRLRRTTALLLCCSAALLLSLCGCIQEMANQPRFDPMEPPAGLPDALDRLGPVEGTVARGEVYLEVPFTTGKLDGELVAEIPAEALEGQTMEQLLHRGQVRFVAFCSHCHGQVGGGVGGSELMDDLVGMVVRRGFPPPPTFHQPRLREVPIGHIFDVITNGMGRMPPHGYLIPPDDRWAIAAYVRALQFSQHASQGELAPADLQQLEPRTASR